MNKSISIIIPAYNEEKKLASTVNSTLDALKRSDIADFEIIIFDDASTDKTGEVADELASKYSQVKVVHNPKNMNLGYNFARGIQLASKEFVGMVPGDDETASETLDNVLQALGKADIIVPYIQNPEVRPWGRRLLSSAYVLIISTAFGLKMRYYNGLCFFKTSLVKKVPITTHGFSYMTEILVKILKSYPSLNINSESHTQQLSPSVIKFIEVPMINRARERGATKAFRLKNIASVFKTFLKLFWEIQVLRKRIDLS